MRIHRRPWWPCRCRRNSALRDLGIALGIRSASGVLKFIGMCGMIMCTPVALGMYYWLYPSLQQWWFVAGSGILISNIWAYFMPFLMTQSLKRKPRLEDLDGHPQAKRAIHVTMHVVLVFLVTAFIEYFYSKYQNTALSLVEIMVAISGLTSLFRRVQINLASFVLGVIVKLYKINPRRWRNAKTVVIFQTPELCGMRGTHRQHLYGGALSDFSLQSSTLHDPQIPCSASEGDLTDLARHTSIEIRERSDEYIPP